MSGNAIVREQHEIFQRLQTVLNEDRSQRAAAQEAQMLEEAQAQNVRKQANHN